MERLAQCRQRACYAAPGLHLWAAKAFVELSGRLGPDRATVITDFNPFVMQVGYGTEEALKLLAERDIPVRIQPGLRIGALIADDFAINKQEFKKKVEEFYGRPMEELANIESAIGARTTSDRI